MSEGPIFGSVHILLRRALEVNTLKEFNLSILVKPRAFAQIGDAWGDIARLLSDDGWMNLEKIILTVEVQNTSIYARFSNRGYLLRLWVFLLEVKGLDSGNGTLLLDRNQDKFEFVFRLLIRRYSNNVPIECL